MDSSTPLPDTQAPAMEPSSDFKSEWNPKCCGEFERDQIDEPEMLSWDLDALSLDPLKPKHQLRRGPIGLALVSYKFKMRRMNILREKKNKLRSLRNYWKSQIKKSKHLNLTDILGDSVTLLEGGCPFCPGREGKPLEHPRTEMSSDEEALEGQE